MNIKVFKDYDEASFYCADLVASTINKNSHPILGLATGSSPLGVYQEIIRRYQKKQLDLANVTTFNLDEYVGLPRTHEQSYNYFMRKNFFDHVNIKEENINLPDGLAEDLQEECRQYSQKLLAMGGTDIQILGIGTKGHIAFNEANSKLQAHCHVEILDQCTVMDNSRFFKCKEDVPLSAITLGMMEIFCSKKIVILAFGRSKAKAIASFNDDQITTEVPVTFMKTHPDATLILDQEAAAELNVV